MALQLSDLLQAKTRDAVVDLLLAEAATKSFPVNDWHSGSVERSILEMIGEVLADNSVLLVDITKGGLLEESTKDWLTLLARSNFQTTRKEATFAEHTVTLTCGGGAGPYTIIAGQLAAADASGKIFRNKDGGVLPPSGSLALTFVAEAAGTAYNVANNAINKLLTPLPAVAIANSTRVVSAVDQESDAELRARAALQWTVLAAGATEDTYRKLALDASAAVKRVSVEEDIPTPGGVRITLAGTDGTVAPADVTAVSNFISPKRPLTVGLTIQAATENVINITATVRIRAADQAAAAAVVNQRLLELLRTIEIGKAAPSIPATLYKAEIAEVLMGLTGARDAVIAAPAADVALAAQQVAKLGAVNITWITF